MNSGLDGRKPSSINPKFVIGTSSSLTFSFFLPLVRVYGIPYLIGWSFTPATKETFLGIKGRITRMTSLANVNTSTGTNFVGVRIAGVDFDSLLAIPPLTTGAFDSGDLSAMNILIDEPDLFAFVADRSGILLPGEIWQPSAVFTTIEVIG